MRLSVCRGDAKHDSPSSAPWVMHIRSNDNSSSTFAHRLRHGRPNRSTMDRTETKYLPAGNGDGPG